MIPYLRVILLILCFASSALAQERAPLAINLASVNDWSTQQPFIDVMKTARRWIGHRPGQWGGVTFEALAQAGVLDAKGWPMRIPRTLGSIGTVILTDLPAEANVYAGRYRLRFDGDGIVELAGRAQNIRYGNGEVTFDFRPGPGPVEIRIQRSDPRGKGDYVRNITVVRMDQAAAFDGGARFNPIWLGQLEGVSVLRFMDWMNTNNSSQRDWSQRPQVSDFSYSWRGVPLEVMLALSAKLKADPWFNMPHLAGDRYIHRFAKHVRHRLAARRAVYVEYSNEVWNWQFAQAEWADAEGNKRWGQVHRGAQFYGMRAAEVADTWTEVFAENRTRLVNVIATQTGWLGLEKDMLNAPLWQAENPANRPPYEAFDAYAITGYFGHALGTSKRIGQVRGWLADSLAAARRAGRAKQLQNDALATYVERHRFDLATTKAAQELANGRHSGDPADSVADLANRIFPYHAAVAAKAGLRLIMYEGGSHVVGLIPEAQTEDLTAFFTHLNYSPEMGALYVGLITAWQASGGRLFNLYADVQAPTKWGSWGTLRYLGDDNQRWRAVWQNH